MTLRMLPPELARVLHAAWRDLDTPISLSCSILAKYGEFQQLLTKSVLPGNYIDSYFGADRYKRDAQAVALLSKCELDIGLDLEELANASFYEAERRCFLTNQRLCRISFPLSSDEEEHPRLQMFWNRASGIIRAILGDLPKELEGRFGKGTVFEAKAFDGIKNRQPCIGDKLCNAPGVTKNADHLFQFYYWRSAWGREALRSERYSIKQVRGSEFFTVPKSAKALRGACKEPGGNLFLQLAVGSYIRRRLYRFGLDLNNGQEVHAMLAKNSSITEAMATIDLSSASDTIAIELVRKLLPDEWFDLLSDLRCTHTLIREPMCKDANDSTRHQHIKLRKRWVRLEKFSSMGNGFTFELETLIFAAIAAAVSGGLREIGKTVFVYGDDIIVPSTKAMDVTAALRYCGFCLNDSKSFLSGPFRESCGGDFFCGVDVRPHFIRSIPNEPIDWIVLANGLFRRWFNHPTGYRRMRRARSFAIGNLPRDLRSCRGPAELGDSVITSPPHQWRAVRVIDSQRWFRALIATPKRLAFSRFDENTQFAAALYGVGPEGYTLRRGDKDEIAGYKVRWIAFS